jgi:hypothetical protein
VFRAVFSLLERKLMSPNVDSDVSFRKIPMVLLPSTQIEKASRFKVERIRKVFRALPVSGVRVPVRIGHVPVRWRIGGTFV